FTLFHPDNIRNDTSRPAIVLTELQISNKTVGISQKMNGRVILPKSIPYTDSLELGYDQNGFTIEFAALNFFNPQKIKYRYKLEGFDQRWQELQGESRQATYTNIDPGEYLFKVVSTDASGNWTDNETSMHIRIYPPFWRTTLAYIIYAILFCGTLYYLRHRGIQRIRKEFLVEQERQQSKRMHDLDLLKIKFLTNVSHEFRTPLSLIITPMEKLIKQASDAEKPQLQLIQRNGRRLLNLVNQLLDFRRMEVHELKLHPRTGDIISFIQELSFSFSDVADRKNISLHFATDRKNLVTFFDHDKIERILFNLLSNAFKFTPQGGKVTVSLHTRDVQGQEATLQLKVADTGIGIGPENRERIFERFFQSDLPDSIVNQGSGIGLSITKEFVKLHGGTIAVQSALDRGSEFIVSLPLRQAVPEG
ncbi:MAG: hybrid sensor histidine kinase/response regulator, partial [Pedobacter sp.]